MLVDLAADLIAAGNEVFVRENWSSRYAPAMKALPAPSTASIGAVVAAAAKVGGVNQIGAGVVEPGHEGIARLVFRPGNWSEMRRSSRTGCCWWPWWRQSGRPHKSNRHSGSRRWPTPVSPVVAAEISGVAQHRINHQRFAVVIVAQGKTLPCAHPEFYSRRQLPAARRQSI